MKQVLCWIVCFVFAIVWWVMGDIDRSNTWAAASIVICAMDWGIPVSRAGGEA